VPDALAAALAERMAAADPQADVQLRLDCPACGHGWAAPFDIGAFLWDEVGAWVERTLGEVHALASAYGWTEAQVLELPSWRRQRYLEMARG
jgi:hypothetical protein